MIAARLMRRGDIAQRLAVGEYVDIVSQSPRQSESTSHYVSVPLRNNDAYAAVRVCSSVCMYVCVCMCVCMCVCVCFVL